MLSLLHGFNDLAESGFFSEPVSAHLEAACLVDRACVHFLARGLFARHRLAGNCGLFNKRVATYNLAIDGDSAAGTNDNDFAGKDGLRGHFDNLAVPQHTGRLREEVQHVLDGSPAPADGQPFQNLGRQHKRGNHQRCKELADRQRRNQRDGHRELHRHAPLEDVLERLLEDRIAANQRSRQPDHAHPV